MSRIDFHILKKDKIQSYAYLARLVEKIHALSHKIFIATASEAESEAIDTVLWTFRATSFVPHHIFQGENDAGPVLISHDKHHAQKAVLINLSTNIPEFYQDYARVIEIIYNDELVQQQGRQRYKMYRENGLEPQIFQIN